MSPQSGDPGAPPGARFRVLFVCVGNVCRSPVGERLLAARLPAERFVVSSAGVSALVGHAMSRYAAEELRSYGGDPTGFTARRLTADMVEHSDLVLAATRELRAQVLADVPAAFRRTFTVLEFAALVGRAEGATPAELVAWSALHRSIAGSLEHDVPDPYRRGPDEHARSARALDAAVQQIAKGLDR